MGWLVTHDRREDLETLIAFIDAHPEGLPVEEVDGRREFAHPWRGEPGLPPEVTVIPSAG